MSASNWDQCPRCEEILEREWAARVARFESCYGQVPSEIYMAEATEIGRGMPELIATFREDYEFYMLAEDGVVKIVATYSGHCEECGLDLRFKDKHILFRLNQKENP